MCVCGFQLENVSQPHVRLFRDLIRRGNTAQIVQSAYALSGAMLIKEKAVFSWNDLLYFFKAKHHLPAFGDG